MRALIDRRASIGRVPFVRLRSSTLFLNFTIILNDYGVCFSYFTEAFSRYLVFQSSK